MVKSKMLTKYIIHIPFSGAEPLGNDEEPLGNDEELIDQDQDFEMRLDQFYSEMDEARELSPRGLPEELSLFFHSQEASD